MMHTAFDTIAEEYDTSFTHSYHWKSTTGNRLDYLDEVFTAKKI